MSSGPGPEAESARLRSPDVVGDRVADLDRRANEALAAVDTSAASQLAVLEVLSQLEAAVDDDGILRGLIAHFRAERQAAFVRHHERNLAAATADDDTLEEARRFTIGIGGRPEDVVLPSAPSSAPGPAPAATPPMPFFARFLERQRR